MKEGIIGIAASGVGFFVFVLLLIYGIVKIKKMLIALAAVALVLVLVAGVLSAGRIARESRKRVEKIMGPRTGHEIYVALFGEPKPGCVHVINQQDQEMPVIDFAIYLEVQTCPQEMVRIAKQRSYKVAKDAGSTYGTVDNISWFTPSTLGDSIWVWTQFDEFGNGHELFVSEDSTRLYCRDIAN